MEYWIKCNNEMLHLPIKPTSYSVTTENSHQTVNIQTRGDVTILGKKGLKSIEFSSFFPAHDYPFADYPKDRSAYAYVAKLLTWQDKPVRLIITQTKINRSMIIKSFMFKEEDGTRDISYSIQFEEYRPPRYEEGESRTDNRERPKTYMVKGNDTLQNIAKKIYGSSSYASKVYKANKKKIEKAAKRHGRISASHRGVKGWYIYSGTELTLP